MWSNNITPNTHFWRNGKNKTQNGIYEFLNKTSHVLLLHKYCESHLKPEEKIAEWRMSVYSTVYSSSRFYQSVPGKKILAKISQEGSQWAWIVGTSQFTTRCGVAHPRGCGQHTGDWESVWNVGCSSMLSTTSVHSCRVIGVSGWASKHLQWRLSQHTCNQKRS